MAMGTAGDRLRGMSFKRSDCAIACALDVVGDKWTLLIVRDLLLGRSRFGEFLNAGEGIPTNVLARRLRRLEDAGLVERLFAPRPRSRYAYRLTRSGRRLGPVVTALLKWSRSQIPGTRVAPLGAAKLK
jgi:DNA-binding HxlR family transcriptional regulator